MVPEVSMTAFKGEMQLAVLPSSDTYGQHQKTVWRNNLKDVAEVCSPWQ